MAGCQRCLVCGWRLRSETEITTSSSIYSFIYVHFYSPFIDCFDQFSTYKSDMPQFRVGNPYFFSENLYQSVSLIDASM